MVRLGLVVLCCVSSPSLSLFSCLSSVCRPWLSCQNKGEKYQNSSESSSFRDFQILTNILAPYVCTVWSWLWLLPWFSSWFGLNPSKSQSCLASWRMLDMILSWFGVVSTTLILKIQIHIQTPGLHFVAFLKPVNDTTVKGGTVRLQWWSQGLFVGSTNNPAKPQSCNSVHKGYVGDKFLITCTWCVVGNDSEQTYMSACSVIYTKSYVNSSVAVLKWTVCGGWLCDSTTRTTWNIFFKLI